jgi:hypothetical protein
VGLPDRSQTTETLLAVRRQETILRRYVLDVLLLGFVVLLVLKAGQGIGAVWEPDGADECSYMINASRIPTHGLPPAAGSPLYSLWYYGLSQLQPDPLRLWALNWTVLVALFCVALYLLTRALGGGRIGALVAVGFALLSGAVEVWPYLMYLATAMLMLGAAVAIRVRSLPIALTILSLTLLAVSYVRPEYFVAFTLVSAGGLAAGTWLAWKRQTSRLGLAAAAILIGLAATAALAKVGNPLGGVRSIEAFGQHYALNVWLAADPKPAEAPLLYFEQYLKRDFGSAKSVGEAWRKNPRAALWHVGTNIRALPQMLDRLIGPARLHDQRGWDDISLKRFAEVEFPERYSWAVAVALLALGLAGQVSRGLTRGWTTDKAARLSRRGLALFAVLLVPTTAAALVVYPRLHYLLPATVFTVAVLAAGVSRLSPSSRLLRQWGVAATLTGLCVILLAMVPNRAGRSNGDFVHRRRPPAATSALTATASAIRELHLRGVVRVFEIGDAITFYSGLPMPALRPGQMNRPFWSFVHGQDIGVIILQPALLGDPHLEHDAEFRAFYAGEETSNFLVFPTGNAEIRFAVRRDLLSDQPPSAKPSPQPAAPARASLAGAAG